MNELKLQLNQFSAQIIEHEYIRYRLTCSDHNIPPMELSEYCISRLVSALCDGQPKIDKHQGGIS